MSFAFLFCRWFFACVSVSGVFAVTFSVIFAYVADCTDENDRSQAYGLVSSKLFLKNLKTKFYILYVILLHSKENPTLSGCPILRKNKEHCLE